MRPGGYVAEKARDIWLDERPFDESMDDVDAVDEDEVLQVVR